MKKEDSLHISGINRNDPELKEKLKRISVAKGVSMSDIIVPLIEDYVSLYQRDEEFEVLARAKITETLKSIDGTIPPLACQLEHEQDNGTLRAAGLAEMLKQNNDILPHVPFLPPVEYNPDDEIPPLDWHLEHEQDNDYSEGDEFL